MDDLRIFQEQLSPVQIYSIGPKEAAYAAPLLTTEAVSLIQSDQAFGLAVAEEGEARGAVCARLAPENDLCLELLSLYVIPQYRRRQLGGTLLYELLEACEALFEGTISRVEAAFLPEPGLEALLKKAGFGLEADEAGACSHILSVAELADSPLMKQKPVRAGGCTPAPLETLSRIQIGRLYQAMEKADAAYMEQEQLYHALPGVSFVLLDAKEQPAACAVFTGNHDCLCLSQFFAAGGNAVNAIAVLQAAAGALLAQYPSASLEIPLLTQPSVRLAERLLGDAGTKKPLMRAVWKL